MELSDDAEPISRPTCGSPISAVWHMALDRSVTPSNLAALLIQYIVYLSGVTHRRPNTEPWPQEALYKDVRPSGTASRK